MQHGPDLLLAVALGICLSCGQARGQEPDTDGDGLSDYQETHKYGTDPKRKDSDGDGVPDGDWRERREFTYTVRSLIQVMPPYNPGALNDDYQDARVLDQTDDYIELEVIHYPLNTNHEAIVGVHGWQHPPKQLQRYLEAGTTTNWDSKMRRDLLRALEKDGIHVATLTDKEVVERVSAWAMRHARYRNMFTTFATYFPDGKPRVHPDLESKFRNGKGDSSWSAEEQWEHELFGRGMFYNKSRGSCTSTAVYLTTVLRAIGIPTRMIVTIPVVDGSDKANVEMVRTRLSNHRVREQILEGVESLHNSFAAHTFNEVWVGGRWRRLNYDMLGQNILDRKCMGLLTHVHTFNDLAEAGLADGWGARHPSRRPSPVFRHNNPYTALTLSDRFGVHCNVPNPRVEETAHRVLTISRAYWFHSEKDRPRTIGADWHGARDPKVGHLMVHVEECWPDETHAQYARFHQGVDKRFRLRARGQPTVYATSLQCYWSGMPSGGSEFYLRIEKEDFARMKKGISYVLEPINSTDAYRWRVASDVRVTRR